MRTPRRPVLLAILALALALRLGHLWAVRDQPFVASLAMDSQEYDRWARQIAAGDWLGSRVFFQAPLYPYLLAAVYTVLGHRLALVYCFQSLLAVAGCWALYRAGREMGSERTGLGAALLARQRCLGARRSPSAQAVMSPNFERGPLLSKNVPEFPIPSPFIHSCPILRSAVPFYRSLSPFMQFRPI